MRVNEDRDFIIGIIDESLKYEKEILEKIKEHPEKVDIDICYSNIIDNYSAIAFYKYALGEPISKVKKYFRKSAEFSKKKGNLQGSISPGHGTSAIYLSVISDDIGLARRIASMIDHTNVENKAWSESILCAYALGELVLNRDKEVLEHVGKVKKNKSDIECYYQGQICKAIVVSDLRLLQDNVKRSLKKHDNLVKYGSYNLGKGSKARISPAGYFCIPAVALGKLAAQRGFEVKAEQIPEQLRGYLPTELVTMSHL